SLRADEVAPDDVATSAYVNAVRAVAGDDVARGGRRAADRVVVGAAADVQADAGVGQRGRPGGVRADEIALDNVVRGVVGVDAAGIVAGDEVARAGGRSTDGVVARTVKYDAVGGIAEVGRACRVRADVVACNRVAGCGRAV